MKKSEIKNKLIEVLRGYSTVEERMNAGGEAETFETSLQITINSIKELIKNKDKETAILIANKYLERI